MFSIQKINGIFELGLQMFWVSFTIDFQEVHLNYLDENVKHSCWQCTKNSTPLLHKAERDTPAFSQHCYKTPNSLHTVHRCPKTGNSLATLQAPCSCERPCTDSASAKAASSSCQPCCGGCGVPRHHCLHTQAGWSSSFRSVPVTLQAHAHLVRPLPHLMPHLCRGGERENNHHTFTVI